MNVRYRVTLSTEERAQLQEMVSSGKGRIRRLKRAQILLAAERGVTDETIAKTVAVGTSTVYRTKRRFVEEGLEPALSELPRPGAERKLSPWPRPGDAFEGSTATAVAISPSRDAPSESDAPSGSRTHASAIWLLVGGVIVQDASRLFSAESADVGITRPSLKSCRSSPHPGRLQAET